MSLFDLLRAPLRRVTEFVRAAIRPAPPPQPPDTSELLPRLSTRVAIQRDRPRS
jgi:hypothetical protein